MNNSLKDILNAIGAIAEMSLHFYRTVLSSGATKEEATSVTQAYIAATLYGDRRESEHE